MNIPPNELLRLLAGGVNPLGGVRAVGEVSDRPTLDFRQMLERAAGGTLETGLPVRVPIGLTPGIEDSERGSLSRAADRAEQEGIGRALVDFGGRTFRVDVRNRAVLDAPDAQLRAVGDIDGYVRVPRAGQDTGEPPPPGGPARVVRNVSLLDALARVRPGDG